MIDINGYKVDIILEANALFRVIKCLNLIV
jgi:hypothetical protein